MQRPAPGRISGFSLDCNGTEKKTSFFTIEQTQFFLHLLSLKSASQFSYTWKHYTALFAGSIIHIYNHM